MKKKKNLIKYTLILVTSICIVLFPTASKAQTLNSKVATYLKLVAQGKISEVKPKLAELIATYPDEPGVILLQGVIQDDGSKALPHYQKVLTKYPNSEWADHAAWRIIQFYCIVGDTAAAINSLSSFRAKYTNSVFLAPATDAVTMAISNIKYNNKDKYFKDKTAVNSTSSSVENTNSNNNSSSSSDKNTNTSNNSTSSSEKIYYGLQVGIYSTLAAAESEKERFIKSKLRTDIKEKIVQGEKKFAVVIGNYSSEQAALDAKKIVEKQCNCNPLIYKK